MPPWRARASASEYPYPYRPPQAQKKAQGSRGEPREPWTFKHQSIAEARDYTSRILRIVPIRPKPSSVLRPVQTAAGNGMTLPPPPPGTGISFSEKAVQELRFATIAR